MSRSAAMLSFCAGAALVMPSLVAADVVTDWNQHALNAIVAGTSPPPVASRALAMVQTAVFDAVNSIDGSYRSYRYRTDAPIAGAQREAAAVTAAHGVLVGLYPAQASNLNTLRDNALAALSVDGRALGEAVGVNIGQKVLAGRVGDGSTAVSTYQPQNPGVPGSWRPTPPGFANPLLPQWGGVQPFALNTPAQFRPPAPPALNSPEYTAAYNEVKALGRATGSTRTAEQTDIARAWAFGGGTITPPGSWNRIAGSALPESMSLVDRARAYAMLNVAMADAAIACWEAKYLYDLWRPVTAIQLGDADTNNDTVGDAAWTSLLTTPNFPAYTSGHSTFSRAGATILQFVLGGDAINVSFQGDMGVVRQLTSLNGAADEAGLSRIYGGIHYSFDNTAGQACGLDVANWVIGNYFQVPAPGAAALLGLAGVVAMRRRRA